jgi:hypothetical protein
MTAARTMSAQSLASDIDAYLRVVAGPNPGARWLEIRFVPRHRDMGRVFLAAHSAPCAARFIRRLAGGTDVYIGAVLRNRRSGGRDAIDRSHLVFIEIDSPHAHARLQSFAQSPTMVVASGTPGHVHAYWTLRLPIGVVELERANRRLAHHLGGDLASTDAARILRPPSSWNHKRSPPTPVTLIELDPARRYDVKQLIDGLADPPHSSSAAAEPRRAAGRTDLDRRLLSIPAADYVRALVGVSPNRSGKIHCPFHDDCTPSLQLYDDGTWYCYGACNAGGSIFDFAARLWRTGTKDRAFLKLRTRLADELGIRDRSRF